MEKTKKKEPMKTVTIATPYLYLDLIDVILEIGEYPSRSEFIRESIINFLVKEIQFMKDTEINKYRKMKHKLEKICLIKMQGGK